MQPQGIPSAAKISGDRSIAETHDRTTEREGLLPLQTWTSELLNDVLADELGVDDIEFAWVEEDEVDPAVQATTLSTLVASGILTANEAREKLGEEPDPSPQASKLRTTRAPVGEIDELADDHNSGE